jgi:Zn-dependent protease
MEELHIVQKIVVMAPPIIFAIVLHEVAHGWVANRLGDHTARDMGRLTLNPLSHIDLFGTILMPLLLFWATDGRMVFGYAKPVPINPYNFQNPKKGMALSSLAGPGINLVMAISFAVILRLVLPAIAQITPRDAWNWFGPPLVLMCQSGVIINVVLGVLNMIPIPPLDGSRVVYWLLPDKQAALYYQLERYGFVILMLLLAFNILGKIIGPLINPLLSILLGPFYQ